MSTFNKTYLFLAFDAQYQAHTNWTSWCFGAVQFVSGKYN